MDNQLLASLVERINKYSPWLKAEVSNEQIPYFVEHHNGTRPVYGRSLRLKVFHSKDGYPIGHVWIIHEYLLDRTIRRLRAFDTQFAFNLARHQLSLRQTERLIEESTRNFAHLHLDPFTP